MMPERERDQALDAWLGLARRTEPEPLTEAELARGAREARFEAELSRQRRRVRVSWAVAAAAVLGWVGTQSEFGASPSASPRVSAGALTAPSQTPESTAAATVQASTTDQEEVATSQPSSMALPTGDVLTSAPGARFHVETLRANERAVRVVEGAVLFEVASGSKRGSFRVATAHLAVRVTGTVFSVEVRGEHSVVRVFEGQVQVQRAETTKHLRAGAVYDSSRPTAAAVASAPLAREGLMAAARRLAGRAPHRGELDLAKPSRPQARAVMEHVKASGNASKVARRNARARSEARPAQQRRVSLKRARQWLQEGEYALALAAARTKTAGAKPSAKWLWVEADALRGLGRFALAAQRFEQAARRLEQTRASGSRRDAVLARYLAGSTHFYQLGNPRRGLLALGEGTRDRHSPIAERVHALRVRMLAAAGRHEDAFGAARRYLDQFPVGGARPWMVQLVSQQGPEFVRSAP